MNRPRTGDRLPIPACRSPRRTWISAHVASLGCSSEIKACRTNDRYGRGGRREQSVPFRPDPAVYMVDANVRFPSIADIQPPAALCGRSWW